PTRRHPLQSLTDTTCRSNHVLGSQPPSSMHVRMLPLPSRAPYRTTPATSRVPQCATTPTLTAGAGA
ncbi:MAG: hypothetical protein JWN44_2607, partial [Myxococcales bacterium]|nr:hypothetical protein [Myxococcales bacterium]